MKTFGLRLIVICHVAFLLIMTTVVSSCKKDQTCHGKVTVIDSTNTRVTGALVTLDALNASKGPGQVMYHATTDGNGEADFDISLPAIFNITATKATYPNQYGKGALNVDEPRKEADVTVKLSY